MKYVIENFLFKKYKFFINAIKGLKNAIKLTEKLYKTFQKQSFHKFELYMKKQPNLTFKTQ